MRFGVEMVSDSLSTPVVETESTKLFDPAAPENPRNPAPGNPANPVAPGNAPANDPAREK